MLKQILVTAVLLLTSSISAVAQIYGKSYPSFVASDSVPQVEKFLPAPPDTASLYYYNDYLQYQWGKSQRNTPRGEQAVKDADMENFEVFLAGFADAFGLKITQKDFPETYNLLLWSMNAATATTYRMKGQLFRKRPFVQFNEHTSILEEEASHYNSSSYPSNHSAAGWSVALILVELNPANEDAILKRGYEFGQSRVIAGYHYQSDVDAARLAAAAAIARVHAEPFFDKQVKKAKKEIRKALENKK